MTSRDTVGLTDTHPAVLILRQPIARLSLHHRSATFAKRIVLTASTFAFDLRQCAAHLSKDGAAFPNDLERFIPHIARVEFRAVQVRARRDVAVPFDRRKAVAHRTASDAARL